MLYTGIDLHKRTVVIATIDETGKVHSEVSLPASRAAVDGVPLTVEGGGSGESPC